MIFIEVSHAQAYSNNNRAILFEKPSDKISKAYADMKTIIFSFFRRIRKTIFKNLRIEKFVLVGIEKPCELNLVLNSHG